MSKAPLFVMVGSGVIIMISLIMIGSGMIDIQEIDVENEAVFQGTRELSKQKHMVAIRYL